MYFDEYLIPYEWQTNWIDKLGCLMINLLNRIKPHQESNYACKNCAYSNQYLKIVAKEIICKKKT